MNKVDLKNLFTKKVQDYTHVILFLLIFSIFIIFAINPSLKTAFSLTKEKKDLELIKNLYEQKIMDISNIQLALEENRDKLYLIDQAISKYPEVNKMVDDVKIIADNDNFEIEKANIADVNLKQVQKNLRSVSLIIEGKTSYENLGKFINDLLEQRRLKTISSMIISQDRESTISGLLKVTLTIEGYYL